MLSVLRARNETERLSARLKKRFDEPHFRERMTTLRNHIAGGNSLFETRQKMEIESESLWEDLTNALALAVVNPGYIMLEWQIRQKTRYQMAAKAYSMAEKEGDYDAMFRGIMTLNKLDEFDLELKKTLGLIVPISEIGEDEDISVSREEIELAQSQYERILDERILNTLEASREPDAPVPLDSIDATQPSGEPDQVGPTPLAKDPTPG